MEEYKTSVVGYMMNHKIVVAALAAGTAGAGMALGQSNEFSSTAKQIGGVIGLVSALYAIAHLDEVSEVSKTLIEADAHVKTGEAELSETQTMIDQENTVLASQQQDLKQIDDQISQLKAQLQ